MAIHGNIQYPEQVWTDTLKEAKEQARKMSLLDGNATIIKSTCEGKVVYYVESKVGMIRTWEKEMGTWEKGKEL